jgi:ribosomal-protein-alanine N-acetyltransferase
MAGIPTFHTPRLILREVVESDVPAYEKYFIDYNVVRTLTYLVPWPFPPGGVLEYLRTRVFPFQGNDKWVWAMTLKEDPTELIGTVDLFRPGKPENRGFWLGHKFWGQGYMTEAVEPVMDYAFGPLGFEKLTFANAVGNRRSARVKEKTGARLIKREPARFVDPALTEHEIYELEKGEWDSFKSKKVACLGG